MANNPTNNQHQNIYQNSVTNRTTFFSLPVGASINNIPPLFPPTVPVISNNFFQQRPLFNHNFSAVNQLYQPTSNSTNIVATVYSHINQLQPSLFPYHRFNPYFRPPFFRPTLSRPTAYDKYLNEVKNSDYGKTLNDYWENGPEREQKMLGKIGEKEDDEIIYHYYGDRELKRKSYCYLLINPEGLSVKYCSFKEFVEAIFYVGKGSKDRILDHFKQTAAFTNGTNTDVMAMSAKHWTIHQLWKKKGVICIQIFSRINDQEALIREAAMIDAINVAKLTNKKRGSFCPPSDKWSELQRQEFGVNCLKRAWKIFKNERILPFFDNEV